MSSSDLIPALGEARERTLALVASLSREDVENQHSELMSPLCWDLAHIAAYEDLWLTHRWGGGELCRPGLAEMYDAFETPRAARGSLPLLDWAGAEAYLEEVRARVLALVGERACDPVIGELVLRHEMQHNETMLQAIELHRLSPAPAFARATGLEAPGCATGSLTGLERVAVPAAECAIGCGHDGFAYDNERPRHVVDVSAFAIGRVPITNATFLHFVEGGGYERREWWTDEGWSWKQCYDITHPGGWAAGDGGWTQWRAGAQAPLHPDEPVVHVSWFEADAFARSHGARLPTEFEWEKAATWDQETGQSCPYPWGDEPPAPGDGRANLDQTALGPDPVGAYPEGVAPCGALGMLGDVWEWTATDFHGYPGFSAHPYREYSEVFFGGGYKVLRGGSWATRCRVITPSFRNWDLPARRQIFSGIRLAWDGQA